jgi:hypothetical protein
MHHERWATHRCPSLPITPGYGVVAAVVALCCCCMMHQVEGSWTFTEVVGGDARTCSIRDDEGSVSRSKYRLPSSWPIEAFSWTGLYVEFFFTCISTLTISIN